MTDSRSTELPASRALLDACAELRGLLVGLDDPGEAHQPPDPEPPEYEPVTAPVVVACSGGPDSLALLAVAVDRGLAPIAVHIDHGLRAGSEREAEQVAGQARALGAGFGARQVAVDLGPNLEARARDARYEALAAAARDHAASAILVGHTADDQAETVLLAVLRGSATAGLGGMPVRRGQIVRPLLRCRRAQTEACVAALGLDPVRDPSNDDVTYRRAWVRHEVLPFLTAGSGRDLVPILARQADILRSESEYLDALAAAAWPAAGSSPGGETSPTGATERDAECDRLVQLPPALARRAVRQWLGAPPPGLDDVDRVLAIARGEIRATQLAGGRRVTRRGGRLFVTPRQ